MHAQQHTRLFINRVFVICKARAVGGPDFSKDRPALLHNFRNSKTVPDFDQFSARDDYLAAAGQRRKRHQHRCGAIVHHNGRFRSGQAPQQFSSVHVAFAARARFEIVFKIAVLCGATAKFVHHRFRQRCAAQISVQNHSRRINYRLQRP